MKHHNFLSVILALSMTAMLAIPASYSTYAQESAPGANEPTEDTSASGLKDEEISGENNTFNEEDPGDTQERNSSADAADQAASADQAVHGDQLAETTDASLEVVTVDGIKYSLQKATDPSTNGLAYYEGFTSDNKNVIIPETVQYDGQNYIVRMDENTPFWFSYSSGVESVEIQCSITEVPDNSFRNCYNLKKVILPDSVRSIGTNAFYYSYNLQSVTWPIHLETIGDFAFAYTEIQSAVIPDSVVSFGKGVFTGCDNLNTVHLPRKLKELPAESFSLCTGLQSITLPDGLESIGESCFYNNIALKSLDIPDLVTSIGAHAFHFCRNMESIHLPVKLLEISPYMLSYCTRLRNVEIPDKVQSIGDYAFEYCDVLTEIKIPDSVTEIKEGAFSHTMFMMHVTMPKNLETIEDKAFWYAEMIRDITLPETLKTIGSEAFSHCYLLDEIDLPDSLTEIGAGAFSSAGIWAFDLDINWPESVTEIKDSTFESSALNEISIPDTVSTIGQNAFKGTALSKLALPSSVTEVGNGAFENIPGLFLILEQRNTPMKGWTDGGQPFSLGTNSSAQIIGTPKTAPEWLGDYSKVYFPFSNLTNLKVSFKDINPKIWYASIVKEAYIKGLMTGLNENEFGPDKTMNRGMAVTVLYRMVGSPAVTGDAGFRDVGKNLYYTDAVVWAVQNGIVSGYTGDKAGLFGPGDLVTREQLCTMAYRYLQHKGVNTSARAPITGFKDYKKVGAYAVEPMQFCVAKGIISGMDNGTMLAPQNYATRAQCAKILLLTSEIK